MKDFDKWLAENKSDPGFTDRALRVFTAMQILYMEEDLREYFNTALDKIKEKHPDIVKIVTGEEE